jgi:hypothetical protein
MVAAIASPASKVYFHISRGMGSGFAPVSRGAYLFVPAAEQSSASVWRSLSNVYGLAQSSRRPFGLGRFDLEPVVADGLQQ